MTAPSLQRALAAGAALLTLGAAACGSSSSGGGSTQAANPSGKESSPPGDIPDNQAFVRYTPPSGGFSVKVPEGWAQRTSGGAIVFTDKLNAIRIESHGAVVPLTAKTARSVEVARLAGAVKGFQSGKASTVTRQAGTAVRITYLAAARPTRSPARRASMRWSATCSSTKARTSS